jgi:hypothetical protein
MGGGLAGALIVLPGTPAAQLHDIVLLIKNQPSATTVHAQIMRRAAQRRAALHTPLPFVPSLPPNFDRFNPPPNPSGMLYAAAVPPIPNPRPSNSFYDQLAVNGRAIPTAASDADLFRLTNSGGNVAPIIHQDSLGPECAIV